MGARRGEMELGEIGRRGSRLRVLKERWRTRREGR